MLNKPRKQKYPLHHNITKPTTFSSHLTIDHISLVATENGIISAAQLSAAILSIKRKLKNSDILHSKIFPHLPVTKRPLEMPLGLGKAAVSY